MSVTVDMKERGSMSALGTAGTTASNLRRVYRCHTINFDLVIKTAKGTGLDVPSFIRLRGDEVIE